MYIRQLVLIQLARSDYVHRPIAEYPQRSVDVFRAESH